MGDSMQIGRFYVKGKGKDEYDYALDFYDDSWIDRLAAAQCETILADRYDHETGQIEVIALCRKFDSVDASKLRDHASIPLYSWWFTPRPGGNYEAVAVREYGRMGPTGQVSDRRFLDRLTAPAAAPAGADAGIGPGSA